jgi:hypothetical protein
MNVPLDRLYNFLQDNCNQDVLIYRFVPHGSRKIEDCKPLYDYPDIKNIRMVCYDQETLDCEEYFKYVNLNSKIPTISYPVLNAAIRNIFGEYHDYVLLLHSELHSQDVAWFEQHGSIGVYWWSHAVIARDWFRYAKTDPLLKKSTVPQKDFLIYNRAWSGLREYRIKFTELILNHNLQDHCQLTFNPNDNGKHWLCHDFANPSFAPIRTDLDQHFQPSTADATASADYNNIDYAQTAIEVVLETVFDNTKWHLTEKALRPIACGHPFILASTPGILQYLKQYGFKTFSLYIDESYDHVQDPVQRLEAIVKLMSSIAKLPSAKKQQLYADLAPICEYNKRRFFSEDFFGQIVSEFQVNFDHGFSFAQQANSHHYFTRDIERLLMLKNKFTALSS